MTKKIEIYYFVSIGFTVASLSGFVIAFYAFYQDVSSNTVMRLLFSPVSSALLFALLLIMIKAIERYVEYVKNGQPLPSFYNSLISRGYFHVSLVSIITILLGIAGTFIAVYGFIFRQHSLLGKVIAIHYVIANIGYVVIATTIYKSVNVLKNIRSYLDVNDR